MLGAEPISKNQISFDEFVDEKGIRHPLLDKGDAEVDETDALFMIGACGAFVSYLINKSRAAGLLKP